MIRIIGAGPAGSYAAYLLARAGQEVTIYEEHKCIGEPVQCTGIVTSSIREHIGIRESIILNEIQKARVIAKNDDSVEFRFSEPNLILDRARFDKFMALKAIESGAYMMTEHKFIYASNDEIGLKTPEGWVTARYSHLIGADGPGSHVARSTGLFENRRFWTGIQARVNLENDNCIEFYPDIAKFAWVVPESKRIARIGLLATGKTRECMDAFMRDRIGYGLDSKDILDIQAGVVPIYDRKISTQKNRVYLLGDAAAQVKATTGGGIVPGLIAAECLADSILNAKDYEKEWRRRLGFGLWLHRSVRDVLDRFSPDDYESLINLCNTKKAKAILESNDRDKLPSFFFKLMLAQPRLLKFSSKLVPNPFAG